MAFWNRPSRSKVIVASAAPATGDRNAASAPGGYKSWQDEAWAFYGSDDKGEVGLGEFRQGVTWLGNVVSRARLIPALAPDRPGDEPTPIDIETNDPAITAVEEIAHGIGGQSDLLRSATVQLTVAGEGWFIGEVESDDGIDEQLSWKFYSRDEVRESKRTKNRAKDQPPQIEVRVDDNVYRLLPENALPVRVWRPHDRYHWRADSSARAALPIMRRLDKLNRKLDAQLNSRLASNGVEWIPEEMDFPAVEGFDNSFDAFVYKIIEKGTTAIRTPGSAGSALPMFVQAKGELIKQVLWQDFAKGDGDAQLLADREFEIKRLSTAMDVPPEVLLGMAGANHWTGWQIEESALKTTVTSLLELICWALTVGYLRPTLAALRAGPLDQDLEDVDMDLDRIVWYDLSELTVRPDRSADTIQLWQDLAVTNECLTRETGLSTDDLLVDKTELEDRIARKLVMSPLTAAQGLDMLEIPITQPMTNQNAGIAGGNVNPSGVEPVNQGDLPRNTTPQAAPVTQPNGDTPQPEPVP